MRMNFRDFDADVESGVIFETHRTIQTNKADFPRLDLSCEISPKKMGKLIQK